MPVEIQVKVESGKVRQSLSAIGDAIPRLTNTKIKTAMEGARDEVRTYPPELPNQRYIRTGNRFRSTFVEKSGDHAYRLVSNPLYHGRSADPYVIGDAFGRGQAAIHVGRWKLAFDVVRRWAQWLTTEVKVGLSEIIRSGGGGL